MSMRAVQQVANKNDLCLDVRKPREIWKEIIYKASIKAVKFFIR